MQKILTDSDDPALLEAVNAEEIPFDFKVGISPFEHIFILTASHKKLIYLQNTKSYLVTSLMNVLSTIVNYNSRVELVLRILYSVQLESLKLQL